MGKINMGRVLLGGIVAGIVAAVLSYFVDGMWLISRWNEAMVALGRSPANSSQILAFNVLNVISGIALVWLYAAIRPRYGAGPRTAVHAAVWFWFIGYLIPNLAFMWVMNLFPHHLTVYSTGAALFETILASLAGASLYKEA